MTPFDSRPVVEVRKQPISKLSPQAQKFFGIHFPMEKIAEIAPFLRSWRNRKILRHVALDEYFEFDSIDRLIPHLRDVLELRS